MHVKKGFKLRPLGNEYILIGEGVEQINFNQMLTLNESAAYLWKQVEDQSDFDAVRLADLLMKEYEVSRDVALTDCQQTIEVWLQNGIIE